MAGAIWIHNRFDWNSLEVLIKNTEFLENVCFYYSQFQSDCYGLPAIVRIAGVHSKIIQNCTFSRNIGCSSVLSDSPNYGRSTLLLMDSPISDNDMTGLVAFDDFVIFKGKNEIRNNRDQQGAGITITTNTAILIAGSLFFHNNTASLKGGAILVKTAQKCKLNWVGWQRNFCSLNVIGNTTAVYFSSNRARQGGSDIYGGKLSDCAYSCDIIIDFKPDGLYNGMDVYLNYVPSVGIPNETSWYLDTPFMKYFNFSDAD